ncbi:MAG: hypothetical protein H0T89_06925 [Deltaproteobacteria bacterium]|nr:hypothetical protein [Deltaproteobacteria bacterium]MDQ3299557.1 hypothetical protein [Myxococcota bacterium]
MFAIVIAMTGCDRVLGLRANPIDSGDPLGDGTAPDAAATCFVEDFAGAALDASRWTLLDVTNQHIQLEQDESLRVRFNAPGDLGTNAIRTRPYDLRGSSVEVELVQASGANTASAFTVVKAQQLTPSYAIDVRAGQLTFYNRGGGSANQPYDITAHRFLRFDFRSGSIGFQTSRDGLTWIPDAEMPYLDDPSGLEIWLGGQIVAEPLPATTQASWDNLRIVRPACVM